jgi:ABC-2 type transport system ATP-binding protein
VLWSGDEPGVHRVQGDVLVRVDQVLMTANDPIGVALGQYAPVPAVALVELAGVDAVEVAHALAEGGLRCAYEQVIVRAEEAPTEHLPAVATRDSLEQREEGLAVAVFGEEFALPDAAGGDVEYASGAFGAQRAGHLPRVQPVSSARKGVCVIRHEVGSGSARSAGYPAAAVRLLWRLTPFPQSAPVGAARAAGSVTEMPRANSIEVEGLVRDFKKGPRAVDGIDLHVDPGEIYGFLGPNGAGKSTTVLMLTTLLPPTAGTARVGGFDVVREGPKVRSIIGAALQEAALDPLLTGRDHMRLQTALHAIPRSERGRLGSDLLARVGLSQAADRKVKGYSGGMKRRLDLALALVHRPTILFLDEPTTGLDPQSRSALWQEVGRLAKEDGVTVFLTTQYLEEADVLADRVGIIDHGRIVAEGTPAALKAEIGRPSVEAVPANPDDRTAIAAVLGRFGEPAGASPNGVAVRLAGGREGLTDVVRALDAEGLEVAHLQLHAPSLDDVFLEKTGRSLEGAADGETVTPEAEPVRS